MLSRATTRDVKLTINPTRYLELRGRHQLAIDTLRKLPGHVYKLSHDGVPRLDKVSIDKKDERQTSLGKFVSDIYDLNEPWQNLLTNREAFNYELTLFPHKSYKRRSLFPDLEDTTTTSTKKVVEKSGDDIKPENKKVDFDFTELGSKMDKSPEAQARRAKYLQENRDRHDALRIEPYLNIFGIHALFAPDEGYALSILGALGNGINHEDKEVRISTIEILKAMKNTVLLNLHKNIESMNLSEQSHIKTLYAKDTLEVLTSVFKILHLPHRCIKDQNEEVKTNAEKLEGALMDDMVYVSKLTKAA